MTDSATIIIRRSLLCTPPPSSWAAPPCDESDADDPVAAGFNTTHAASHWDTGVPFREPASHSSSPSSNPFPQNGPMEEADDDSSDEEASDDAENSLLAELSKDDDSDELAIDAREKKRTDELWLEERSKLQSGSRNGSLERIELTVPIDDEELDATAPVGMADATLETDDTVGGDETGGRKG